MAAPERDIEIVEDVPRPFWQSQSKELAHTVNFVEIFQTKLASIQPLNTVSAEEVAWEYRGTGIQKVVRRGVAAAFQVGTLDDWQMELWLEDPKDIADKRFPHGKVKEKATEFTKANKVITVEPGPMLGLSAEVVQDENNRLILCLPSYAESIQRSTRNISANSDEEIDNWLYLLQRYGIDGIVGTIGYSTQWVMNIDLLGKLRRDRYILELARRYKLTNTQFCRFQALSSSAEEAEMSINYERLAEEVIKET